MITSLQAANILADSLQKQLANSIDKSYQSMETKVEAYRLKEVSVIRPTIIERSEIKKIKIGKDTYAIQTQTCWACLPAFIYKSAHCTHYFNTCIPKFRTEVELLVNTHNEILNSIKLLLEHFISNIRWDKSLWGQLNSNYITKLRRCIDKMYLEGIKELISDDGTPIVDIK